MTADRRTRAGRRAGAGARVLSTYVNCSLGGMTSVFRARALADPGTRFDLVFGRDRGGTEAFDDLPGTSVRVVPEERLADYLGFVLAPGPHDWVTVTSQPWLPGRLRVPARTRLAYEVHAAVPGTIRAELAGLDLAAVDELWAPSRWSVDVVRAALPPGAAVPVRRVANLVHAPDPDHDAAGVAPLLSRPGQVPVLWIGRMENVQKNYADFLRVLRLLPEPCYGLMLFSFETDPARLAAVLGAAAVLGVEDRVDTYLNVPQQQVLRLHRAVRDAGGVFCSTSLAESFGYGVLQAAAVGLPVCAYDVGALAEHRADGCRLVPVGDLRGLAAGVLELSRGSGARRAPGAARTARQVDGLPGGRVD